MNADLPKLTTAGFDLLSALASQGYCGRVSKNMFRDDSFTVDGDHVSAKLIYRLVKDGYLVPNPVHRPLFYDVSDQARKLFCPKCRGGGLIANPQDDDLTIICTQCSGRRIIAPGTDHTPPYKVKVKAPREPNGRLLKSLDILGKQPAPSIKRDPSPKVPGYYWLALDDGGAFIVDRAFLVVITLRAPGDIRVTFPGTAIIELMVERWEDLRETTVHKFSENASIGGLIPTSTSLGELRLTWLGRVTPPYLPDAPRPEEDCIR